MALYAVHIANGTSSNTSLLRLFGRYLSGTGVVQPGAFTVSAQASPNMTVKVSGSAILDDLVIRPTFGGTYHGWNTGTENVTIPSNATGITKIDHVVAYVDTAFSSGTADNPGALVLTTVRGTGTAAPSDAEINTALSSKPWIRLAEVTVANGASSINSGNITDKRTFARVDGGLLNPLSVDNNALGAEAVSNAKLKTGTDEPGGAWTSGSALTITGWSSTTDKNIRYKKIGRMVTMQFDIRGTSNATTASLALPYTAAAFFFLGSLGSTVNNGTETTSPGRMVINGTVDPSTLTFNTNSAGAAWTASGGKSVLGVIVYESAA